jgi:transcriptional regulator with XRE-family HTH domain
MALDPTQLGQAVRDRRKELGLKQADLAAMSSVSEPTVRAVETGRTNASDATLASLSRQLGWNPDHLAALRDGRSVRTAAERASSFLAEVIEDSAPQAPRSWSADHMRRLDRVGDDLTEREKERLVSSAEQIAQARQQASISLLSDRQPPLEGLGDGQQALGDYALAAGDGRNPLGVETGPEEHRFSPPDDGIDPADVSDDPGPEWGA